MTRSCLASLCAVTAAVALCAGRVQAAPPVPPRITTESLLAEMTDLEGMATFPSPAYTCRQSSSYDRQSKSPAQGWFANNDCGHYLRVEERAGRREHVMLDANGPGAIVRIWSANPAGTLRIYLDGADRPVIEANMTDLLGGRFPGLPRPLAEECSKGWNLYFPIPYARHCKVTSDQGSFYYHVDYRTYESDTQVESFRLGHIAALREQIDRLAADLADPLGPGTEPGDQAESFALCLEPGQSEGQEYPGSRAFSQFKVRASAPDLEAALRGVIVRMAFDGEPCVEAPLGDLFGTAPGINPFAALPLAMTRDGWMICRWPMPFRESAAVTVVNLGPETVTLEGELQTRDYAWTERSMHFHAKWRAESDVPTRPMQDWNYLTAQGRGVFAGAALAIDNPVKDWWGEGDEKIYVDGEAFPSHFGTGTEDYYGYAWCWTGLFTHAYHSQSRCDGPRNYGRTSMNRFHILDRIPFARDLRFDMELWHWNERCRVNMAVTAYWYARPGATDTFRPILAEDACLRPMPAYVVLRVPGALEGEDLRIVRVAGHAEPQDWDDTSGGRHLWWRGGQRPGDRLTLAFPSPKAGRCRVFARFLSAQDYGIHQIAVNQTRAGGPMDFYREQVQVTTEMDLGVFDLREQDNTLSVTVVGAHDKAVKAYMFGLDYLLLRAAD